MKLRVAHILPWPTVGGIEIATLRIAEAVREHGIDSVAFCPERASPVAALFEANGFEVSRYSRVEPSYRRPTAYLRNSWLLARSFRAHGADIVHCSDMLAAYYGALAGRLARIPVLSHIRSRYDSISRRDQSFLKLVQHYVFVSQSTRQHFGFAVSGTRSTVVYDGIDVNRTDTRQADHASVRREFHIPDGVRVIGTVARVAPVKDFYTLVRAARRVVDRDTAVRFLVVGDHSTADTYRAHYAEVLEAVAAAGLTEHFIFTDIRDDVDRMLSGFDIFTLCTHLEGMPLVVLEAMAHGLPVIVTDVDGVPEVVVDGVTGLLHAHEDADGLAGMMLSLLDDKTRAATLGSAARASVERLFTRERFAASMVEVYRALAGYAAVPQSRASEELEGCVHDA